MLISIRSFRPCIIADGLQPRWGSITMAEYVECLYTIAKNATFAASARDKLLSMARSNENAAARAAVVAVPSPADPPSFDEFMKGRAGK